MNFQQYLAEKVPTPEARAEFAAARRRVRAIADLLEALDAWRHERGLSKAEVARRMATHATAVSRLFNEEDSNPTFATFVDLLEALNLRATVTFTPREDDGADNPRVLEVRSQLVRT